MAGVAFFKLEKTHSDSLRVGRLAGVGFYNRNKPSRSRAEGAETGLIRGGVRPEGRGAVLPRLGPSWAA